MVRRTRRILVMPTTSGIMSTKAMMMDLVMTRQTHIQTRGNMARIIMMITMMHSTTSIINKTKK